MLKYSINRIDVLEPKLARIILEKFIFVLVLCLVNCLGRPRTRLINGIDVALSSLIV